MRHPRVDLGAPVRWFLLIIVLILLSPMIVVSTYTCPEHQGRGVPENDDIPCSIVAGILGYGAVVLLILESTR